ncbi:MAG: exonuclease SbcCD subunit D [Bacteroidota bacterium]
MKILHTADIHLGSNAYGRVDPKTGLNTRLLDFKRSFQFMVQRALEEDIDLFLFAGDAYRTADPTPTQQRTFAECLKPIADAGIPIAMVVGNHDHPVSYGKASALDIFSYVTGEVHLFRKPDKQIIQTKSGPLQFLALPWPIRSMLLAKEDFRKMTPLEVRTFIETTYTQFLERAVPELDPALPAVLACHLSAQGAELSGSERTSLIAHEPKFTVSQLAQPGIDYVALGHIHRHQDLNAGKAPPVVYSSSIERITFKEWEETKGFVIVEIDTSGAEKQTRYTFVPTPARPFVAVYADAEASADPTTTILDAIAAHDIADAVVRVRYTIHEGQVGQVDLSRIREALKPCATIASIERSVTLVERQRRTVVTRESSLEDAMGHYITQREDLHPLRHTLVTAALALEAEDEARRRDDS